MRVRLGPAISRDGEKRLKNNKEIENEVKGGNIENHVNTRYLEWAGHIMSRT